MERNESDEALAFSLPLQVVSQTDINRLLRELESLETELLKLKGQSSLSDNQQRNLLRVTEQLAHIASLNKYDLKKTADRKQLLQKLIDIRDHAPLLHISFAAEPSPKVTETILGWLRSNVHRHVLLRIGLQPSIAVGCILRTPNKVFDLSLKSSFDRQKPFFVEVIKGAAAAETKQ